MSSKSPETQSTEPKVSSNKEIVATETLKQKGIYLLPNLFTTTALFAGFYAIIAAFNEHYIASAVAIFVAMIFDTLDGRVARMTNTQSAFGGEYDSLSDVIAFGLAPALVAFLWSLNNLGKIGWIASFIYVAGTALRLARFNTQIGVADKKFFVGLASPAAAAIVAATVWTMTEMQISGEDLAIPFAAIVAVIGVLMVSNFKYYSFKELGSRKRVPFVAMIVIVFLFALVAIDPASVLLVSALLYAASGPLYFVWVKIRRKKLQ